MSAYCGIDSKAYKYLITKSSGAGPWPHLRLTVMLLRENQLYVTCMRETKFEANSLST
jgi:hypothetical protein